MAVQYPIIRYDNCHLNFFIPYYKKKMFYSYRKYDLLYLQVHGIKRMIFSNLFRLFAHEVLISY